MRKILLFGAFSLFLWGCSPLTEGDKNTSAPTPTPPAAVAVAVHSPQPNPSKTPSVALLHPQMPPQATKDLKTLPVLKPEMTESEVWYADSGIRENGLEYYASEKDAKAAEAELAPVLEEKGYRPFIAELGPVFDFEGLRISVMVKEDSDFARMVVLAPLGDPPALPESLRRLKLPKVDLGKVGADLKGKQTLVIMATGKGLAEAVDHSLAEAGLSVTATPSATPTDTPTP